MERRLPLFMDPPLQLKFPRVAVGDGGLLVVDQQLPGDLVNFSEDSSETTPPCVESNFGDEKVGLPVRCCETQEDHLLARLLNIFYGRTQLKDEN